MASSSCADNLPPEASASEVSENNLQPFFVLHKASQPRSSTAKSIRGKKKTKSAPNESETSSDIHRKMDAFHSVWSKIESNIKDVLRTINADAFDEIRNWVIESFDAIQASRTPEITAKTSVSYPVLFNNSGAISQRLSTGLVFTKNMEIVDDILTFEELSLHLTSHGCHVATISSLDFCSKNGVGGCLRSLLQQFLLVDIDAADISLLASWHSKHGNCEKPVVVIIEDLERCCGTVLSDFIILLSEWAVKIPTILIVGVSTNIDAPRNILSSHALEHLSPCTFVLKSPAERLDAVIEAVFIKHWAGFSIGHTVATFLRNYFLRQDGTLTSFIRAMKIAIVQLIFKEPLSFVLKGLVDGEENKGSYNVDLANLSKALIKQAFDLPSYCKHAGNRNNQEESNVNCLANGLLELQRLNELWGSVVMCLYEAGKHCKVTLLDLYWELLSPELCKTMLSVHHPERANDMLASNHSLSGLFQASEKGTFIDQVILKVRDLPVAKLSQLLKTWEKLAQGSNEVQKKILELQSMVQNADNRHSKRELTDLSKRHLSRGRAKCANDEDTFNEKAANLVYDMMRECMQPIESIPFHEIVCFKDVDKLQSALTGDPRRRIQSDLLEFQKILKCSCCSKGGVLLSPSMHDASIMYTLAQEHGDLINLHDWFQSFNATVSCLKRSKQLCSPKKRKVSNVPQNKSDASIQARFCRAIIELQIAGLLRAPSKRRPDYVQRVAFGL
nr:origin of replication complex subunit 3 [Ipomoea batatas]